MACKIINPPVTKRYVAIVKLPSEEKINWLIRSRKKKIPDEVFVRVVVLL
jgi:hypothetical protein